MSLPFRPALLLMQRIAELDLIFAEILKRCALSEEYHGPSSTEDIHLMDWYALIAVLAAEHGLDEVCKEDGESPMYGVTAKQAHAFISVCLDRKVPTVRHRKDNLVDKKKLLSITEATRYEMEKRYQVAIPVANAMDLVMKELNEWVRSGAEEENRPEWFKYELSDEKLIQRWKDRIRSPEGWGS